MRAQPALEVVALLGERSTHAPSALAREVDASVPLRVPEAVERGSPFSTTSAEVTSALWEVALSVFGSTPLPLPAAAPAALGADNDAAASAPSAAVVMRV